LVGGGAGVVAGGSGDAAADSAGGAVHVGAAAGLLCEVVSVDFCAAVVDGGGDGVVQPVSGSVSGEAAYAGAGGGVYRHGGGGADPGGGVVAAEAGVRAGSGGALRGRAGADAGVCADGR